MDTKKRQYEQQDADLDGGVEERLIDACEDQGFAREVDLGKQCPVAVHLAHRRIKGVDQDRPQQRAGEHENRIGDLCCGNLH